MLMVTGANGNLGGLVARHLMRLVGPSGFVAGSRDPASGFARELAASGVEVRRCDFDDPASLPQAFAGVEAALIISTYADNSVRAAAYGMPGHRVTGNDPLKIFAVAGAAIARARAGKGPSLIEIETYRLEGHFMGDAEGYRAEGEVAALKAKDPIAVLRQALLKDGTIDAAENARIEAEANSTVSDAIAAARAAPFPEVREAFEQVFA